MRRSKIAVTPQEHKRFVPTEQRGAAVINNGGGGVNEGARFFLLQVHA